MAHPETPGRTASILQGADGYEKALLHKIGDSDRKNDRRVRANHVTAQRIVAIGQENNGLLIWAALNFSHLPHEAFDSNQQTSPYCVRDCYSDCRRGGPPGAGANTRGMAANDLLFPTNPRQRQSRGRDFAVIR